MLVETVLSASAVCRQAGRRHPPEQSLIPGPCPIVHRLPAPPPASAIAPGTAFHRQHVQVPDLLHQFDGAIAFAIASSRLAGKFNQYRRSRIKVRQGLSRAHSPASAAKLPLQSRWLQHLRSDDGYGSYPGASQERAPGRTQTGDDRTKRVGGSWCRSTVRRKFSPSKPQPRKGRQMSKPSPDRRNAE